MFIIYGVVTVDFFLNAGLCYWCFRSCNRMLKAPAATLFYGVEGVDKQQDEKKRL